MDSQEREEFSFGGAVIVRSEYDRPLADLVERLDRDGDGGLSPNDCRRHRHGGARRDNADQARPVEDVLQSWRSG